MAEKTPQASGVQALISRIRDDGVQAGQSKAEEIIGSITYDGEPLLRQ